MTWTCLARAFEREGTSGGDGREGETRAMRRVFYAAEPFGRGAEFVRAP